MKKCLILVVMISLSGITTVLSATITGHAFLEGQSDHSGITVTLRGSPTIPSFSVSGALSLIILLGVSIRKKRCKESLPMITVILLTCISSSGIAALLTTTITLPDGSFSFQNLAHGLYRIEAQKACYVTQNQDPVYLYSETVELTPLQLTDLAAYNEHRTEINLRLIAQAEMEYNNNSIPHTFVGDFYSLVTGSGAGNIGFLPEDFLDGIVDGYQYDLEAHGGAQGSLWYWSVSVYPVSYPCTGRRSFYTNQNSCDYACQSADIDGLPGNDTLPYSCMGMHPVIICLAMRDIIYSETDYNANSLPHTYTDSFYNLTTGEGAGDYPFLCPALITGELCGYHFELGVDDCNYESCWLWWCTAYPLSYGGETVLTFYADQSGWIRAGDINGAPGTVALPLWSYPTGCE